MGKEKSAKDSSKKSSKKKPSTSGKKVISKTCGSTKSTRSKVCSKVSSQKSSKASSRASSRSQAKPVASSRVSKAIPKRSGGASRKSKSSKKKPPTSTKTKSGKSKKTQSKKGEQSEAASKGSKKTSVDTYKEVQEKKSGKKEPSSKKSTSKKASSKPEVEEEASVEPQELVAEEVSTAEAAKPEPSNVEQEAAASEKSQAAKADDADSVYEGAEGEEEEKIKEEKLEFTKPTINQMKKAKKERPLSMAEKITVREYDQLFDEITELNSGVGMLKHSYGGIIKSLVALQNRRRANKKAAKEVVPLLTEGKVTFLTTLSTCDPNELRTKSCLEATDKYDIERFLNPLTREETFQMLFDEVDDLNKNFEKMRPFYDARGRFQRDKYDSQNDIKLDRAQFNEFRLWAKKLSSIVDDIARNYNDDLLSIFRLS